MHHHVHHRLLRLLLVLTLFAAACSRGGESKVTTPPVLDLSPGRQTDWLPAESAAVGHVDFKGFRATPIFSLVMQGVTDPAVRDLLTQIDSIRGALLLEQGEPEFVLLVQGTFPADFDMAAAMGTKSNDSVSWFKTPEGFWIAAKSSILEGLRTPPELRVARLSDRDWARAPTGDGLLARLTFALPAEWRDALGQKMAESTDPNVAAMLRPAVEELRVVSLDMSRVAGTQEAGIRVSLAVDFDSSRGAQTAGLMLQAMTAAAQAQMESQPDSPSTAASSAAEAAAAATAPGDEGPQASVSIAEQFGRELAKKALSTANTQIEGNRVIASIQLDDAVLLKVAEVIADETKKPATVAPAP